MATYRKDVVVWATLLSLLIVGGRSAAGSVVCRNAYIQGFEGPYSEAKAHIGDGTTSDLRRMKVYVTLSDGYIYAHSNYKTPGFTYPTKIAHDQDMDAASLVLNLVGKGVSEERIVNATENDVVFIVDEAAFKGSRISVDFTGVKNVTRLQDLLAERRAAEAAARAAEQAAERIRRSAEAAAEAAAKAARIKKRADYDGLIKSHALSENSFSTFRRTRQTEILGNSTADMKLFGVLEYARGAELQLGDQSLFLSSTELATLKQGKALANDHPLSVMLGGSPEKAFVLYTDKLTESKGATAYADELAFSLQKSYPDRKIFRDPFSAQTSALVSSLASFTVPGPQHLVTVIADDSFEVTDWKIIQNIEPDLAKLGYGNVLHVSKGNVRPWTGGAGKGVIVITGHIDAKLAEFVRTLGQAGYFKGNYVLLNTCNDVPTRALVASISADHGALGTFCYDSKIKAGDVEGFVYTAARWRHG